MPASSSAGRFAQLDGLRALAIAVVIAIHALQTVSPTAANLIPGASGGVDLFFALSGFLITYLLLNEQVRAGEISLRMFYARRAVRLIPALMGMLIAQIAWSVFTGVSLGSELRSVALVVSYGSNFAYAYSSIVPSLAHTWSLAVEAQFYFIWPAALLLLLRRNWSTSSVALVAGGISILGALDAAFSWWMSPHWNVLYVRPDIRFTTLMAGASAAALVQLNVLSARRIRIFSLIGWAFFLSSIFFAAGDKAPFFDGEMFVLAWSCVAMVVGAALEVGPLGTAMVSRPVKWLGERSYGLYLWHVPVLVAFEQIRDVPAPLRLAGALIVAVTATACSYRWIERPLLARKARFAARATRVVTLGSSSGRASQVPQIKAQPRVTPPGRPSTLEGATPGGLPFSMEAT